MALRFWVRTVFKQTSIGAIYNNILDWSTIVEPSIQDLSDLNDEIATNLIPLMNTIQLSEVGNVQLHSQWRGNASVQHTKVVSGGGAVTGGTTTPKPQLAAYIRLYPETESYTWADDTIAVAAGRRILRGAFYLGGVSEDWMGSGESTIPVALSSDVAAFLDELNEPQTTAGNLFTRVIHGYALDAITGDNPKPARDECFSEITFVQFIQTTWLHNRKGNYR